MPRKELDFDLDNYSLIELYDQELDLTEGKPDLLVDLGFSVITETELKNVSFI